MSRTQARAMSPQAQVGWLSQALTELGLDTGCLVKARELVEAETRLSARLFERQALAVQRQREALQTVAENPSGDLDAPIAIFAAESVWLDIPQGREFSVAGVMVRDVRRMLAGQVGAAISGQGGKIFDMVRAKAAEVVAEVAALPRLPAEVYATNQPGETLAKYPMHRSTYGTLLSAAQSFGLCHSVADLFRDQLGYSQDYLDGAPPSALAYRNWHAVLADMEWLNIRPVLKLKYACEHGFDAGLWLPSEVTVLAEDKRFGARLRHLGSAVLSGTS